MSKLTREEIENNFADISPRMTPAEALLESNRCLYCYDAPCIPACPTHIDVPSFIKKISTGNLTGAARVIFDANPIGGSCARVCPVEVLCEGACVEKTLVDRPIQIGRLQRYATDHIVDTGKRLFTAAGPNGKSVGIIGSGPAGLSCATYLARAGYEVTVYEKRDRAGGLNTFGMAEYKMRQSDSLDEVAMVESLGVRFELNVEIGRDLSIETLKGRHDVLFIGVGLGSTRRLNIPGEDKECVVDALTFIESVKTREWSSIKVGGTVVVIGAGNTAIDAVTQAKRLGASKAVLVYRRGEKDAPAYDYEIALAKTDGIEFSWHSTPLEILGNGSVSGLKCARPDGTDFVIDCDMVIVAIGQDKQSGFLKGAGIETDAAGRAVVDGDMRTSDPKVFAGGDCVNGGAEAVHAAQDGKLAATGIHRTFFGGDLTLTCV
jgi:glutamate synthase (NADPH/NADH) small chain